ncbi:MAG: universal stress protein [Pirellulaceae bacterium]|jgi:nucleotide-binding universal stress UspA family protein|nr:universal stress protein [Pirellulaceae bacterium]MDP7017299.1 universal stress protein [Pirellulaceae bacterium]
MDVKKILVPVDFSHAGDAALGLATALARDTGAKLVFVHAQEPATAYGGGELYYGALDPSTDELQKMLARIEPTDSTVPHEHRLISGDPAHAIVRLAEEESCDMIVMGTHGRTGLSRMLMGSVAEAVVRRAGCPVLTYKQPAAKSAGLV